jgi:hypothetical protein
VLAPADAYLPDCQTLLTGNIYRNPDLRITMTFDGMECPQEVAELTKRVMADRSVAKVLDKNKFIFRSKELRSHFVSRSLIQIRLAAKTGSTLLGNRFFQLLYSRIAPYVHQLLPNAPLTDGHIQKIQFSSKIVKASGLAFTPSDLEAFYAIRSSKDILEYSKGFRAALRESAKFDDCEDRFLELMLKAMDTEEIATKAASAFQTAGSVTTALGFIPVLGTAASCFGALSDAAGRASSLRADNASWFLLGPKMQEVAIRSHVAKAVRANIKIQRTVSKVTN